MFVKMLTVSAGPDGCFPAGTVREVTDAEGEAIIAGRFGEQVVGKPVKSISAAKETAAMEPPETAAPEVGVHKTRLRKYKP